MMLVKYSPVAEASDGACTVLYGDIRIYDSTGARTLLSELRKLFTDFRTSGNTFFLCSQGALCQREVGGWDVPDTVLQAQRYSCEEQP